MSDEKIEMSPFSSLPADCIAKIISFTSPKDAGRAAVISLGFRSAAESDTVWNQFLPPDYREIVSGSHSPVNFSTKKELYLLLCDSPLLLDGGKLSFRLSRSTGKKCYMLCARELRAAWISSPQFWEWKSLPESRFAEVAELLGVSWLEIHGIMNAQMLSRNTNYEAYLVFKLSENHYGLNSLSSAWAWFVDRHGAEIEGMRNVICIVPPPNDGVRRRPRIIPASRADGWLEIKLAEFFIDEGDDFEVNVKLLDDHYLKKGLIVEGIELRPKEAF